ncbi:MAG TPA: hypothetical protein VEK79_07090 [Thermoanaerobaculia bacterium]|nr:hypothetical protein [Thermoanaerobaculia bacterium]
MRADVAPTLHEVLIAFQKSLSRAREKTQEVAETEGAYKHGDKTLFAIDALDVELCVSVAVTRKDETTEADIVRLDFQSTPAERSKIRFRVAAQALEVTP